VEQSKQGRGQNDSAQVEVGIARIFVKDLSFESPKAPAVFQSSFQPALKVDVQVVPKHLNDQFFEVSLNLLIEAKHQSENIFVVEIEQAGVFEIKGAEGTVLDHILTVFAPNTLFPYARSAIDQTMMMGSLPPLMINQINFELMRQQRLERQTESQPRTSDSSATNSPPSIQ
jgi:preprotein translocase subunit SecB